VSLFAVRHHLVSADSLDTRAGMVSVTAVRTGPDAAGDRWRSRRSAASSAGVRCRALLGPVR
jgi:hypothetical protein